MAGTDVSRSVASLVSQFKKTDFYKFEMPHQQVEFENWYVETKDLKAFEGLSYAGIHPEIYEKNRCFSISGIVFFYLELPGIVHFLGDISFESNMVEIHINLDNETAEKISTYQKAMMQSGALDAWVENIVMKKGRAGHKLCALVHTDNVSRLIAFVLNKIPTLGLRQVEVKRIEVFRKIEGKSKVYYDLKGNRNIKTEHNDWENEFLAEI